MRTNQKAIDFDDWLDANLQDRTLDKFHALPDFYVSRDGVKRYTNMEDAVDSIKQEELIGMARALRDGNNTFAGILLRDALMRVCESFAEEELEEEFERGQPQIDAAAAKADYLRQRARDAEFDGSK